MVKIQALGVLPAKAPLTTLGRRMVGSRPPAAGMVSLSSSFGWVLRLGPVVGSDRFMVLVWLTLFWGMSYHSDAFADAL